MKKRIILSAVLSLAALANSFSLYESELSAKMPRLTVRLLFPIQPIRMVCFGELYHYPAAIISQRDYVESL